MRVPQASTIAPRPCKQGLGDLEMAGKLGFGIRHSSGTAVHCGHQQIRETERESKSQDSSPAGPGWGQPVRGDIVMGVTGHNHRAGFT